MVALSASRLVCSAIEVITSMTLPISSLDEPSFETVALVASATVTAVAATLVASPALWAISRTLAFISSTAVATVCTFELTCSLAAETTLAWAAVSSAFAPICADTAASSDDEPPRVVAFPVIEPIAADRLSSAVFSAAAIWPASSRVSSSSRSVRSPRATPCRTSTARCSGREISRDTTRTSPTAQDARHGGELLCGLAVAEPRQRVCHDGFFLLVLRAHGSSRQGDRP
jgi:hypothetical protein